MLPNVLDTFTRLSEKFDESGPDWRPIPGHQGYVVSACGQVKGIRGNLLSLSKEKYSRVMLQTTRKKYLVHRLVALAFIPNPNNLPQVNHKDGNKRNNHASNLEWCDAFHNMRHCEALGLKKQLRGSDVYNAKLTDNDVAWIKVWRREGFLMREIAHAFGVAESTISRVCSGIRWPHKGGLDGLDNKV
jgi:hypothetical protein